ncbi:hypothetical protein [Micromonospora sp. NPDC003816]|uniref:hypothetical protein n=1 Tax=Micromonospora sp. NPDC003816 TaxID=3364224 RepID=UPI00367D901C
MEITDIITSAIAVLALIVSCWSAWFARASSRAAERQAVAAEAALPPPAPDVAWVARRVGKGRYLLTNVGTRPASGVQWVRTGDRSEGFIRFPDEIGRVLPGGDIEFFVVRAMGTPVPTELLLAWDGQSEPEAIPIPS